jgi:hypothetical protein
VGQVAQVALPSASAFNPGAKLWVVPEFDQHPLIGKIDWYLNFQLSKALRHQPAQPAASIKNLILACELPNLDFKAGEDCGILIPSGLQLPNRWVLSMPSKQRQTWVKDIHQSWSKLGRPSLRVFLPQSLSRQQFAEQWNHFEQLDSHQEYSVIEA